MLKRILVAAGLLGAFTAGAAAKDIKVGSECTYPPFNFRDAKGELQGFDIDVAREIGKRLNANLVFVCQQWDGMIPALLAGKFDLIVASMSITDERKKSIDFSDKYYNTPAGIIGSKDAKFEATPEGLKGKIIGVQVSTVHEAYAKKHFADVASEIKIYQTQDEAQADLAAGRVDAVQADSLSLATFLATDAGKACCDMKGDVAEDVEILGPGVGVGLRQGDTELKDKFNAAIKSLRDSGKYAEIAKKYFDFDIYGK